MLKYKEGMTYMRSGNEEGGIWSFRTCGVLEEFEKPDSEGGSARVQCLDQATLGPGLQWVPKDCSEEEIKTTHTKWTTTIKC